MDDESNRVHTADTIEQSFVGSELCGIELLPQCGNNSTLNADRGELVMTADGGFGTLDLASTLSLDLQGLEVYAADDGLEAAGVDAFADLRDKLALDKVGVELVVAIGAHGGGPLHAEVSLALGEIEDDRARSGAPLNKNPLTAGVLPRIGLLPQGVHVEHRLLKDFSLHAVSILLEVHAPDLIEAGAR